MASVLSEFTNTDSNIRIIINYFLDPCLETESRIICHTHIDSDIDDVISQFLDDNGVELYQVNHITVSINNFYLKKRKYGQLFEIMGED